MNEKELKINKRLKVGIITFSILTVIMLIGNKSYAIFQKSVKTDKPIITINTIDKLPPKFSGLAKYIVDKAYQGESSEKEIIAINKLGNKCDDLKSCVNNIREYRYSGPEVNNYIYLKEIIDNQEHDEIWRIIGIFIDEDTNEVYLKVIRDKVLPESYLPATYKANGQTFKIKDSGSYVYWNRLEPSTSNENNNWSTAGLQYYLNGEQDEDGNDGYLSYLSSGTKDLLKRDVKYYLGSVDSDNDNARTAYEHERDVKSCPDGKGNQSIGGIHTGCKVWEGNDATWNEGPVALMYPSDYGYSAISENWDKVLYGSSLAPANTFRDTTINGTSWMYSTMADAKSSNSWNISPSYKGIGYVIRWDQAGPLNGFTVFNNLFEVRPILSLKSETTRISGEGTKEKPYKVLLFTAENERK